MTTCGAMLLLLPFPTFLPRAGGYAARRSAPSLEGRAGAKAGVPACKPVKPYNERNVCAPAFLRDCNNFLLDSPIPAPRVCVNIKVQDACISYLDTRANAMHGDATRFAADGGNRCAFACARRARYVYLAGFVIIARGVQGIPHGGGRNARSGRRWAGCSRFIASLANGAGP